MSDNRRKRSACVTASITLAVVPIMVITGCGGDATEPQAVVSVVVTPENATLVSLGETVQLTASARDADGNVTAGKTFAWQSSDVLVVRVDSSGLATAVANGTTTVTATTEGILGSTTVAVRAAAVILSPSGASISGIGATQTFGVEAWDADGNPIPSPSVSWNSLNTNVATVDGSGIATAIASGQVTIQADVNGMTGYALLTVSVPGLLPADSWSAMTSGTGERLIGVWGASSSDIYAVGDDGTILQFDGTGWSAMVSGTSEDLHAVWGTSPSDIYAVGEVDGILHYDGTAWSQVASAGENLLGVWGASPSDVYAVGSFGTIVHFDGTSWTLVLRVPEIVGGFGLTGVWGTSSSNIYAVGDAGTVLHYDGIGWSEMESGTESNFQAVWGTSPTDVYAVGGVTIAHYDGIGWNATTRSLDPRNFELTGVWGSSASDVYAVEFQSGSILHYDGSDWAEMAGQGGLRAVWGAPSGNVFAVGENGAILRGSR